MASSTGRNTVGVKLEAKAVSAAWVRKVVSHALQSENVRGGHIGVLVGSDRRIHGINRQFLDHDYPTDVISFDLSPTVDGRVRARRAVPLHGEIVVSVDTAKREARERGIAFREELARYLVHGTLHLLGYDDKKPALKKKMFARQEKLVNEICGRICGRRPKGRCSRTSPLGTTSGKRGL